MNQKSIVKFCKNLGCCDACCLRYLGLKNPDSYVNVHQYVRKFWDSDANSPKQDIEIGGDADVTLSATTSSEAIPDAIAGNQQGSVDSNSETVENTSQELEDSTTTAPPVKRMKMSDVCVSCLGVLQEDTWPEGFSMVQELLDKKRYECETIACALSSPMAAILREKAITLLLEKAYPGYDYKTVMPLKEAWKWLFGRRVAALVGKRLDSGAVAPLLLTLHVEYPDDAQELEEVRALGGAGGAGGGAGEGARRGGWTRRGVEAALAAAGAALWPAGPPRPGVRARAVGAAGARAPQYVGGRYVKLSRALPQTPWLVAGRRMLHSSVQEIIFAPVADAFGLAPEEAEHKMKMIAAGREDVDVRCLGTGRPFALEVADAPRVPSAARLAAACAAIAAAAGGAVRVARLVPLRRDALALLKSGEEARAKTYEALCVKLGRTSEAPGEPPRVCAEDLARLNAYRNTAEEGVRVALTQRTPLRVLHRRPLLARRRALYGLEARAVEGAEGAQGEGRSALFVVRLRAAAGTYVKEWAHGDLRRTAPALRHALGAAADLLALDVAHVDLPWPPEPAL